MSERDDIFEQLGALPKLSPPPAVAERIRLRARRELRAAPAHSAIGRLWHRVEPALLAAFAVAYLGWSVSQVIEVRAPAPSSPTTVAAADLDQRSAASARDW